jgi:16S rRNA processing protein RimM
LSVCGEWETDGGGPAERGEGAPPPARRCEREPALDEGPKRVALAAVTGAHGVRGEVRLKLFTSGVESLTLYGEVQVGGAKRRLLEVRQSGRTPVARFEGVSDRAAAEALRGSLIEVDRSALPPLEEGEYYHADLIGLAVVDREDQQIGHVVAVENYGAGDLLEIENLGGQRSLVPYREGIADLDQGRVIIDPQFLA